MNRLTLLLAIGAVLLVGSLMNFDDASAESVYNKPNGMSQSFTWTLFHDTTAANYPNRDTLDSLPGKSGSNIFWYQGLSHTATVTGQIWSDQYAASGTVRGVDTNTAGNAMDTAADTTLFIVLSAFSQAPDSSWIVYTGKLEGANTNNGAVEFTISPDSTIGDYLFMKFVAICADSNVADTGSSITYRSRVNMRAKE